VHSAKGFPGIRDDRPGQKVERSATAVRETKTFVYMKVEQHEFRIPVANHDYLAVITELRHSTGYDDVWAFYFADIVGLYFEVEGEDVRLFEEKVVWQSPLYFPDAVELTWPEVKRRYSWLRAQRRTARSLRRHGNRIVLCRTGDVTRLEGDDVILDQGLA